MMFAVCSHRCRTNFLLAAIVTLVIYSLLFEPRYHHSTDWLDIDDVDLAELEEELECYNPVHAVDYRSPLNDSIFLPRSDISDNDVDVGKPVRRYLDLDIGLDYLPSGASSSAVKFHRVWTMADRMIDRNGLWPTDNDPLIMAILEAMRLAPIVGVDVLDIGEYESGTSNKWIATLMGGQKVVLKIDWGDKGKMKDDAQCNTGFEMPHAEIAAFHLHRLTGFNNTPYVTGRKINILRELVPHASLAVSKQIVVGHNNRTCVKGSCYNCKDTQELCRDDSVFEFSMAYWVPRKLRLYTFPPKYMPFSTPRMDVWGKVDFNNRSYCDLVRRTIEPYDKEPFYLDLFDFAVLDTLMYHYDSKHYSVVDRSNADGLVVRLDHGRAFCAYDRDDEHIFLAPITQCCTLRKSTFENLETLKEGQLKKKLNSLLKTDPLAPILDLRWYSALERRLKIVLSVLNKCIMANGRQNVLIDDRESLGSQQ